jgi:hypothetical protein
MIVSAEMISVSPDGSIPPYPNKLRLIRRGRHVYVEISAVHDSTQVTSTVIVEAPVLRYHLEASGVLHG